MPGWPTGDRADDHELAGALRRADPDAPARLYDSYGERLHDYAFLLAGSADVAADAVHDALVTALGSVRRLRTPTRLRAWLYALTRFQVRARLAHRPPARQSPEPGDEIHETVAELTGGEREILELSLRHHLTPSETGAVLGLTARQATARLARARDRLENSAAAVLLARTGRAHCPGLSALLNSWEGPLTSELRRRLAGHIAGCEVCTEGRRRRVSAVRLLETTPVAYPPKWLRLRVIDTCGKPELDQTRTLIMDRVDGLDRAGFPVPPEHRRGRPRRSAPVVLAGVCLLAATGAMVVINGRGVSDSATPRPSPTVSVPAEEAEPTREPLGTPTPSRTRSTKATPEGRPARPDTRPPPPAPVATRRRAAPAVRLAVSCPETVGEAARIALRARGGAVTWRASASDGLEVEPASGSIRAGAAAEIWVTVAEPAGAGSGRVSFTSSGGTAACDLEWEGVPEPPDPPTDDPSETGRPTAAPTPDEEGSSKGGANVE